LKLRATEDGARELPKGPRAKAKTAGMLEATTKTQAPTLKYVQFMAGSSRRNTV
jgi:hypothetical protein